MSSAGRPQGGVLRRVDADPAVYSVTTMIDASQITTVIFDFDGTMCSGRYFEPLGEEALETIGRLVFGAGSSDWADPWMRGDLTSRDIAAYLNEHLAASEEVILSALHQGCAKMTLNPAVVDFALQQRDAGRKIALVTANMDVFTEVVVPAHGLDRLFGVVLNTADHRTLDKSLLWRRALETLGADRGFSSALLIDDSPRMVARFEALGGHAFHYTGDHTFRAWLAKTGFA